MQQWPCPGPRRERVVPNDFHLCGREIVDGANLNLAFASCFLDGSDDGFSRSAEWDLSDDECVAFPFSILARSLILPLPLSYSLVSMRPPCGKSGRSLKRLLWSTAICALSNSMKLCGITRVDNPTAIPSEPNINSKGSLLGSMTGSRLRPS